VVDLLQAKLDSTGVSVSHTALEFPAKCLAASTNVEAEEVVYSERGMSRRKCLYF
jgi:hypothetical protein